MSPDQPGLRPAGETGPRSFDERYRSLGDMIVMRILALVRVGRSYAVGNQVFRTQLESFLQVLRGAFEDSDEAVLVNLDSDLYLNGVRIPVRTNTYRFHEQLRAEFERRLIAGLRFTREVTADDVQKFFALFLQPDDFHGAGLLEACLAEGLDTVQPAVHATATEPVAGFADEARAAAGRAGTEPAEDGAEIGGPPPIEAGEPGNAPRGAPPKAWQGAIAGARSLLMSTSLDVGMELRQAKRVVQPLVDGAFADEPVVMGLTTLGHHDEFTYMHAVNTGMVAVTIGHFLGLDRRTLSDLAVASLLHDAGKGAVGDQVKHPFDAWTSEDRAAAERHPIEGARQIARATVLSATSLRCMRVALEHHAGPNGYPALDDWTPSVLSQIVAVADCYVSLLGHRSARGRAVTPYDAIGMMLGPLASRFEPAMLWALVRSVGLYPPGQVVKLEDGSIAVVLLPNRDDVLRPHARVIVGPHGEWLGEEGAFDHRPLPRNLPVKRALSAEEYPKPPEARAA